MTAEPSTNPVVSLRQLRHVLALAEHRHFGRAASAVGITQAALTLSIQNLEDACGVPLFERRKGEAVVTQYGEVVLETAKTTINRLTQMRRELALARNLAAGRLIVGCDAHFADSLVAPALARVMKEYPRLEFMIEDGKWSQMKPRVLNKEIDLYLGFEIESPHPQLACESHRVPPFVAFCRTGHEVLKRKDPGLFDCFNYPIVVPPTTQWIQTRVKPLVAKAGFKRMPAFLYTTDFAIIRRFVRDSNAIGMGHLRTIRDEVEAGRFKCFTLKEFSTDIDLSIVVLETRSLPVAAQFFLKAVHEEIAEMRVEWAKRSIARDKQN